MNHMRRRRCLELPAVCAARFGMVVWPSSRFNSHFRGFSHAYSENSHISCGGRQSPATLQCLLGRGRLAWTISQPAPVTYIL